MAPAPSRGAAFSEGAVGLGPGTHRHAHSCPDASTQAYPQSVAVGDIGTFAGLATDRDCRVLDRQRKPIPGLYAVGNDAASIMGGNYPGAGITLGPALTFGYLAGMHLATAVPRPATTGRDALEPAA